MVAVLDDMYTAKNNNCESWIGKVFLFEWFILLEIQHDTINVEDVDI